MRRDTSQRFAAIRWAHKHEVHGTVVMREADIPVHALHLQRFVLPANNRAHDASLSSFHRVRLM
jgi:hypothetical protein